MDVVNAEQAKIAEDAGAAAVMALERVPADIRARRRRGTHVRPHDDRGDPGRRHHPGDGEGAHRALRGGAGARGARGRLHRRVRGPDARRRGPPHRQVGLQDPLRVRRDQPGRGAAAHRRGRRDDPLQGRGGHRQRGRGRAPHPPDHGRDPAPRHARADGAGTRGQGAAARRSSSSATWPSEAATRGAVLRRRHRHPGRRRADDAAGRRGQLRGLRDLQVLRSQRRAPGRSSRPPPTTTTPERVLAASRELGEAMPGIEIGTLQADGGLLQTAAGEPPSRRRAGPSGRLRGARAGPRAVGAEAAPRCACPRRTSRARRARDPGRRVHHHDARHRAREPGRAAARPRRAGRPGARHLRGPDHARPRAPRRCST